MADHPAEAHQGGGGGSSCCFHNILHLPDALITRILCFLSPKCMSAASATCTSFYKLINSQEFLRDYELLRANYGWIVTDNSGSDCPLPHLFLYDILSQEWNSIAINKICDAQEETLLNPRMVSACGGLVLFMANKRRPLNINGVWEPCQELAVVNPMSRCIRRLPDPPLLLSPHISSNFCIEMVTGHTETAASSYKVILFAPKLPDVFFVYNSCLQSWKSVGISNTVIPLVNRRPGYRIVSSRSVMYKGILYWLIVTDLDASYLVFYDTQRDALHRETLCLSMAETKSLCGISVWGSKVVAIFREEGRNQEGELGVRVSDLGVFKEEEKNREGELMVRVLQLLDDDNTWSPLVESRIQNLGCDAHRMVVCSNEEKDYMLWMVCLVTKVKKIYGHKMIGRHMQLVSFDFRDGKWQQLSLCQTGEGDDKFANGIRAGISHRPLSQAKWLNLRFSAPV